MEPDDDVDAVFDIVGFVAVGVVVAALDVVGLDRVSVGAILAVAIAVDSVPDEEGGTC